MSPSAATEPGTSAEVLDVLGVGFGPSNLALAIALAEHNLGRSGRTLTARFVEQMEAARHRS